MGNFKINCDDDNQNFVATQSYHELLRSFLKLKNQRGRILHVVGAPGVGKSANIYQACAEMELKVYEAGLFLDNENVEPKKVFELTMNSMKKDLGVKTDLELYHKLKEFDVILIADRFHDSHLLKPDTVGYSQWSAHKGWSAVFYYFYCIKEYLGHKNDFRNLNLVFQTSWRVYLNAKKFDLFTELGIISRIALSLLKIPFQVVEITYSPLETINIVKSHFNYVDEDRIKKGISIYDCKPRFICEAIKAEKI